MEQEILRSEYPRPQFVREEWETLNGIWDFSFDEPRYDRSIRVPFAYEAPLSGIGLREFHDIVWYRRFFVVPEGWEGKCVVLHIGAADLESDVWVNGMHAVQHTGGQTGFSADITEMLREKQENELCIRVRDRSIALDIPRGKQYWKEKSDSIFYTGTVGIWQSVWLEPVERTHLSEVRIIPLLDERAVCFEYEISQPADCVLKLEIDFEGKRVAGASAEAHEGAGAITIQLREETLGVWNIAEELGWTPEHPYLFNVVLCLFQGGKCLDRVRSYFGFRSVAVENGRFLLNGHPYYQRLLLDQGYWPQGLLTAPSDEAFAEDIRAVKALGYNGVRKHQKVEDPRFLYHADKIGLLVWGEIGSGYVFSQNLVQRLMAEWVQAVRRDCNHPCIVVWTPMNESWGATELAHRPEQRALCRALFHLTKALDQTRPVSENDGWEHTEDCELLTVHDYSSCEEQMAARYSSRKELLSSQPAGRRLLLKGVTDSGAPVIVSEFGGISFRKNEKEGWGYSCASSEKDFLERYRAVLRPLLSSLVVQGFCYTQLCDVEQETNGLLNYDRTPKAPVEKLRGVMYAVDTDAVEDDA